MKHAIDKAGKSLEYNEVKDFSRKSLLKLWAAKISLLSYRKDLGSMLLIHNPHISQSRLLYQDKHSLKLSEFAIVLYLCMRNNLIKIPPERLKCLNVTRPYYSQRL